MEIQSWMIRSWPLVEWYLPATLNEWPVFSHMGTQVHGSPDLKGHCAGNTVWLGSVNGRTAGAAWDWTEWRTGVVLLSNPNAIVSNLRCRSDGGLTDTAALNLLAHALPWQEAVLRVLKAMRDYPVPERPAPRPRPRGWRHDLAARA